MIAPQLTENYNVEKILYTPFDDIKPYFSATIYKVHTASDIDFEKVIRQAKIECRKSNNDSKKHYYYFDETDNSDELAVMTVCHKSVPSWLSERVVTRSKTKSSNWEDYKINLVVIYSSMGYMFINCQDSKILSFFQIALSKIDSSIISLVDKEQLQKTRAFRGKKTKIVGLKNALGHGGGGRIPESKSYTGSDCSKSLNGITDNIFGVNYVGATDKEKGYSGASVKKRKVWGQWTQSIDDFSTMCDEYALALNSTVEETTPNSFKFLAKSTPIKLSGKKPVLFSLNSYKKGKGVLGLKYEKGAFKSWNTTIPTHEKDIITFQMWLSDSKYLECHIQFSIDESNNLTFNYAEINEHEPKVVFFGEDAVESRGRDLVKHLNSCDDDYRFLFKGGISLTDGETFVFDKLKNCFFDKSVTEITWDNVDITKEEKTAQVPKVNILKRLQQYLEDNANLSFGINDNGANEVADLVALFKNKVVFIHAKYSKKPIPGLRIGDIQEVSSQAIKNINFTDQKVYSDKHLERLYNNGFYNPQNIDFEEFKNKFIELLENINIRKEVWIVQPGISKTKLETQTHNKAHTLLSYVELVLDSARIDFKFFCSP